MADKYGSDDDEYDPTDDIEEDEIDAPKIKITKTIKPKVIDDDEDYDDEEDEEDDLDDEALEEDDDEDINDENIEELIGKINSKENIKPNFPMIEDDDDDEYDEDIEENYLQKFDENIQKNIISEFHPELNSHNSDEIEILSKVVRNENGVVIDPLHKTLPFITRYEKARILGERAKQLNAGAKPMVEVDINIIDGYLIALKEFEQKKIPFIIKRPLPNGGVEYWKFKDLEVL
jgi:DNA-directed RNA polymerase I, II, and III subunit RPABC2